jgi:YesN/AraC family two-component response regulator
MDGLQMATKLRALNGKSRIIVLSGYSEFQYAKQSIELGVDAYLLKPIDEEELAVWIIRAKNSIEGEKRLKDALDDGMAAAKNKMAAKLATGQTDGDSLHRANEIYGMELPWKTYQVMLVDTADGSFSDSALKNKFKDEVVNFAVSSNSGFAFDHDGITGILLKDVCFDENSAQPERLRALLKEKLKLETIVSIGPFTDSIDDVRMSYEYAERLVKSRLLWGGQRIVGYGKDTAVKFAGILGQLAKGKMDVPLMRIMEYIHNNYCQQIKLESLAQMFGYNSIYLGQLFKSHTGMYFNTYLEKMRIGKARQLLAEGAKVRQAAEQAGFNNLDYFSSRFRKHTGVSPSEYKWAAKELKI